MTSNRDRRAARARLEREMAQRAAAARRRRRLQMIVGICAAALVLVGGVVWIVVATSGDGKPTASPTASASPSEAGCEWRPLVEPPPSGSPTPSPEPLPSGVREVGTPPPGEPRSGKQIMTITTNLGVIKVEIDLSKTPCAASSFSYLASKKFFDNSSCHRIVPGIAALQCGDPSGEGTGGPTYRYADEYLPAGRRPAYTRGAVALANSGPGTATNGSQFFFVYADSELQPDYTLLGRVTEGIEIVDKVAAGGHDGKYEPQPGGGKPKVELKITSITLSDPTAS